jgi:replicative DNA helicase
MPGITDSYEYMARKLKDGAAKRELAKVLNSPELAVNFRDMPVDKFTEWLQSAYESVTMKLRTNVRVGTDLKADTDRFLDEYRARKAGESFRIWRSKFNGINTATGGYQSANMFTWYGRSGRGKSVIVAEEAFEAAFQGATVLVWALEMAWYDWLARAYTSISARFGTFKATINGVAHDNVGFSNSALRTGQLTEEYEAEFTSFLARLNEAIPGRIIVRGVSDPDFNDRSLRGLEADIIATEADVIVVDPFYYLDYEANTSRKTGGDAEATSKKLRQLAGKHDVVIHAITQADEDSSEKDDDGNRELRVPKRAEIKKTKQLLEDAAATFGIDTLNNEGRGAIELGKGRNGGEDERIEIVYLPNYGIVREMAGEVRAEQFTARF